MRRFTLYLAAIAISLSSTQLFAQASLEDAKKANNPLANMKAVALHNYSASSLYGVENGSSNTFWIRYAQPVGKFLVRASVPTVSISTDSFSESGLGDMNIFATYLLSDPTSDKQFGVGPLLSIPTATKSILGTEKWQAGVAAIAFLSPNPMWQTGGLVTWQTSFAGSDDRSSTNLATVQLINLWQLGKGFYLRSAPIILMDFKNDAYQVPFSVGAGKVLKVNKTLFNLFVEPQYTVYHKGANQPKQMLLAGINLQFL